jgi:dipeptidyl aminopeptidase/acylaminoacyl peptidase
MVKGRLAGCVHRLGAWRQGNSDDVRSFDGLKIPAILYKPRDIPAGARWSAIVVHGGPSAQWFRGFDAYAQFLVDMGYVVIEPNIRGSTGYGVQFRDMALRNWGGADLEDVAGAAHYVPSLANVDPQRIGVFGGSYGDYMTFIAVTRIRTYQLLADYMQRQL